MNRALGEPVLRHVIGEPTAQEHLDGVGADDPPSPVVAFLHPAQEREPGASPSPAGSRSRRPPPRRAGSRRSGPAARGIRRGDGRARRRRSRRQGRQSGEPVHDQRIRIVAEPVGVRDRQAVRLQEVVHRDLVVDPVGHRRCAARVRRARGARAGGRRPRRRCPTPGASGPCVRHGAPCRRRCARPMRRGARSSSACSESLDRPVMARDYLDV